jgi:hypothetical protein
VTFPIPPNKTLLAACAVALLADRDVGGGGWLQKLEPQCGNRSGRRVLDESPRFEFEERFDRRLQQWVQVRASVPTPAQQCRTPSAQCWHKEAHLRSAASRTAAALRWIVRATLCGLAWCGAAQMVSLVEEPVVTLPLNFQDSLPRQVRTKTLAPCPPC